MRLEAEKKRKRCQEPFVGKIERKGRKAACRAGKRFMGVEGSMMSTLDIWRRRGIWDARSTVSLS
jgi:hypothetical protein